MSKESNNTDSSENTPAAQENTARVMGVSQFLERNPQVEGIDGLIRSLYAKKTMTEKDWLSTVKTLLERKVK